MSQHKNSEKENIFALSHVVEKNFSPADDCLFFLVSLLTKDAK